MSMQVYVEIDQFRALLNRYKTDGKYQCVHQNAKANRAVQRCLGTCCQRTVGNKRAHRSRWSHCRRFLWYSEYSPSAVSRYANTSAVERELDELIKFEEEWRVRMTLAPSGTPTVSPSLPPSAGAAASMCRYGVPYPCLSCCTARSPATPLAVHHSVSYYWVMPIALLRRCPFRHRPPRCAPIISPATMRLPRGQICSPVGCSDGVTDGQTDYRSNDRNHLPHRCAHACAHLGECGSEPEAASSNRSRE